VIALVLLLAQAATSCGAQGGTARSACSRSESQAFLDGTGSVTGDYGARCDGSDEHLAIQACITGSWECLLPGGRTCSAGSTTLTVPTGHSIVGRGMQASVLQHAGGGCGVTFEHNDGGGARGVKFSNTGVGATSRGLCLLNVTGPTLRLSFEDVMVVSDQSAAPVAGSYGVFIHSTTTNSMYYSDFRHLVTLGWDRGVESLGDAGLGGANANWFSAYSSNANVSGFYFDTLSSDNWVQGHCNASGTAYAQTCIVLGDGVNGTQAGNTTMMASDQGASGQGFVVSATAVNDFVFSASESSVADQLLGDSTTFILDSKPLAGSGRNFYSPSAFLSGTNTANGSLLVGQSVRPTKQVHVADANYAASASTDFFVGFNTLSAARTLTLNANSGQIVFTADEDGSASGVKTITATPPAGGTVDGAATKVVINSARGKALLLSVSADGKSWISFPLP
jgi:hypothetical protein